MARTFVAASAQSLASNTASVTAVPFTMACWFKPVSAAVNYELMALEPAAGGQWFQLQAITGNVQAYTYDGTGVANAISSTSYTAGGWHHACGRFTSATSRDAFLDGAGKGSNTTSSTPAGINRMNIGRLLNGGTPVQYMDGDIAEAAIWNVALDDAEIAALAAGVSPLMVRPTALVNYWPIIGNASPEIDPIGRNELVVTGATQAAHCRILYPSIPQWRETRAGAAQLAGDTTLTFTPAGALTTRAVLSGDTTVTFTPTGKVSALSRFAGDTTLTFTPSGDLQTDITVFLNGVQVKANRYQSEIRESVNQGPATASFLIRGATPVELQELKVFYAGTVIFDGQVTGFSVEQARTSTRVWYRVEANQWANLLNRRLATEKAWSVIAANTVVTDILTLFTSGFTSVNVQTSLATISLGVTNEQPLQAIIRAAQLVGAYFKILTTKDIYFRTSSNLTAPATLDTSNKRFKKFKYRRWTEQARTRILAFGAQTSCPVTITAATLNGTFGGNLPVVSAAAFVSSTSGCTPYAFVGSRMKLAFTGYTSVGSTTPPTTTASAAVGATSISVSSKPSGFGAGWLSIGGQYIYCTSFTSTTISGIPASGTGSIVTAIASGTTVLQQDALAVSTDNLYDIQAGAPVQVAARVDDTTAQTALAALEGGDGIHEFPITDPALDSFVKLVTLATSELTLGKSVLEEATFTSEDLNAVAGASQAINTGGANTTLPIMSVRLYWIRGRRRPQRDCVATTQRKTLTQFITELFNTAHAA